MSELRYMNREDIKFWYECYLELKKLDTEKAHNWLVKLRKNIRYTEFCNRVNADKYHVKTFYPDNKYGETKIKKFVYPWEFSEEEKFNYKQDNWVRIYSPYDCTGKYFTQFIDIFIVDGKTIVYHTMGLDV